MKKIKKFIAELLGFMAVILICTAFTEIAHKIRANSVSQKHNENTLYTQKSLYNECYADTIEIVDIPPVSVTTPKPITTDIKTTTISKKKNKTIAHKSATTHASYSSRCLATTKRGTQCKRSASSGSNYCWQHR